MEKPAETTYNIHDLLERRWSPRAFAKRPIEPGAVHSLLEAARWAPSSFNEQPWAFIVAPKQKEERFQALVECLSEGNQMWAGEAPLLMLSIAKLHFERNGKENRHAYHDVGMAVENLVIQALDLGLFAHQMAGFDVDKARETFEIPEGWDPVAAIALGYPGNTEDLPDELEAKEYSKRERKPFKEFAFGDRFGEPLPFESRVRRALAGD